ncbi:MAG: DUF1818 family protein [Elainellaceae cyanobacterium]
MARRIKHGEGWRIGWDDEADTYQGLIGGDLWSLELTQAELDDFCRLVLRLDAEIRQIAQELMEAERLTCEAESHLLWLEADGYPNSYRLHVMLLTGRRGEGFWPETATQELIQAIQTLYVF